MSTLEVEARLVTYDVLDYHGEVFLPGCLDEALDDARGRLPVSAMHVDELTIGHLVDWRAAEEGPVALLRLDGGLHNGRAELLVERVRSGAWPCVSIAPRGVQRRTLTHDDHSRWSTSTRWVRGVIVRSGLAEVSLVKAGAVPGARILSTTSTGGGRR